MFLQKIVLVLMALLVFAIPLGSGRYSFNIDLGPIGLLSVVGILAFVFALAHLLFGHRGLARAKVPMDPSVAVFGVFVALNFASVGWAQFPGVAVSSSFGYLQLLIFVWLLVFLRHDPRAFGILLHAFFAGSFLVLMVALYDIDAAGLETFEGQRYAGFDIHTNILAFKLALGVAVAFYLFQRSNRALRWFYLAYIPGAAFLLVLTGSRTGFVILAFASAIGFWSVLKVESQGKFRWSTQRILWSAASLAVVAIVAVPYVSEQLQFQTERIATVTEDETAGGRAHLWAAAARAYIDQPVLGVGSGGSRYVLRDYIGYDGLIVSLGIGRQVAHNVYLGVAADTGTAGALLYLIALGLLLLRIVSFPRPERLLFLSLIGVALIAGMTLSLEQNRDFYFALFLSVAMATSRSNASQFDRIGLRAGSPESATVQVAEVAQPRLSRVGRVRHQS